MPVRNDLPPWCKGGGSYDYTEPTFEERMLPEVTPNTVKCKVCGGWVRGGVRGYGYWKTFRHRAYPSPRPLIEVLADDTVPDMSVAAKIQTIRTLRFSKGRPIGAVLPDLADGTFVSRDDLVLMVRNRAAALDEAYKQVQGDVAKKIGDGGPIQTHPATHILEVLANEIELCT